MIKAVACIGMTTDDTVLTVDAISPGVEAVDVVTSVTTGTGGKGFITAATAAWSGVPAKLFGFADPELSYPKHPLLDTSYVVRCRQRKISTWTVVNSQASSAHTYVDVAPTVDPPSRSELTERLRHFGSDASVWYVTAEDLNVLDAAADLLRQSQLPVVINACTPLMQILAAKEDTLTTLLDSATAVLVNESEWTALLQLRQIADGALQRLSLLREVVVTEGRSGGRFAERPFREWSRYEAERVPALCNLGAGDTFNGSYLADRWIRATPLREACERAAATAARKVACGALHLLDDLRRKFQP